MQYRHRLQQLTLALMIVTCLVSGYYSFFVKPHRVLSSNDGVAKWEERMQPLRKQLPETVREVGYIADPEITAHVQEYSLTRYALAPVAVRQGVEYEWIIGNFTEAGYESILEEMISTPYEIQGFGSGIYLIHRTLP